MKPKPNRYRTRDAPTVNKAASTAQVAPTPAPPVPLTEGQRLLLALEAGPAELAAKLGTSRQAVHHWRHGGKRPGASMRAALEERAGIPAASWDAAPKTSTRELPAFVPPVIPGGLPPKAVDLLHQVAHLEHMIASVRASREDGEPSPAQWLKGVALEVRLREQRGEACDALELLDPRSVTQHPAWLRIRRAVLDALVPHAQARREVVRMLEEIGA